MSEPTVKFLEEADGSWHIEGLICPIGGPLNGQDLTGSHFTKATDFALDWFDGGRPGLYRHGLDESIGLSVIGREEKSWKDGKGVWLRAQIDKAHEYAAEIKQLLDEGLLSLSSGAVDHLVKISTKSGEIATWPWVEWSLVPNPANPEAVVYQVKSTDAVAHLTEAGTEVPAVLAVTADVEEEPPEPVPEGPASAMKEAQAFDMAAIQSMHDAAVALGADCAGAGKATDVSPVPVLAIRAGDDAETHTAADLGSLRLELIEQARVAVKERLGL